MDKHTVAHVFSLVMDLVILVFAIMLNIHVRRKYKNVLKQMYDETRMRERKRLHDDPKKKFAGS